MADAMKRPAPRPCVSCPYRRDVPSGVWSREEYEKLPPYDGETFEQPPGAFMCHQQDGRLCAGWVGCHDMLNSFALRLAVSLGGISPEEADAVYEYATDVPLFASGTEAAAHGLAKLDAPDARAVKVIDKLASKKGRR